jgi:hypothetical protein
MPNPDKLKAQALLQKRIDDAKKERTSKSVSESSTSASKSSGSKKSAKVVKKPPRIVGLSDL